MIIQYLHDELEGSQLQEVVASDEGLVLGFYRFIKDPKTVWLVIDLDHQFPFVGLYDHNPWPKIKKTKPTALFLNSHFKNSRLKEIKSLENYGRVAEFDFSHPDKNLILELRLIPRQPNVVVKVGEGGKTKSVNWEKPKELVEVSENASIDYVEQDQRSIPFMFNQWLDRRSKVKKNEMFAEPINAGASPYDKWVAARKKDLVKKEKALQQIETQVQELLKVPWSDIGSHLKSYGFQNLPVEWSPYIDYERKVSYNIEKCFEKMKQVQSKVEGASKRQEQVREEIEQVKDVSQEKFEIYLEHLALRQGKQGVRRDVEGQFRKFVVDQELGLVALMGKSAADNLKLLRQSKAWDLWVHLKDYPSAYAVLQKPKDKSVSDSAVIKSAEWLVKESFKNKKTMQGSKVSVVVAECRHVRPIKGDKLGRVTYHYPKEFLITV